MSDATVTSQCRAYSLEVPVDGSVKTGFSFMG